MVVAAAVDAWARVIAVVVGVVDHVGGADRCRCEGNKGGGLGPRHPRWRYCVSVAIVVRALRV